MIYMKKPDFREIGRVIDMLRELDCDYQGMFDDICKAETAVREGCRIFLLKRAENALSDIPVGELKGSGTAIRTAVLEEAGYQTLKDLYSATDRELLSISGIGEKQATSIRMLTEEFLHSIAEKSRISLTTDSSDRDGVELITRTARYRKAEEVLRDASPIREEFHSKIERCTEDIRIRNGFQWFFSGGRKKEETVRAVGEMIRFCQDPLYQRARRLVRLYAEAVDTDENEALTDFRNNSASYYALYEKMTGTKEASGYLYNSIPLQLASEISREELDLGGFRGNLRAYQEFGARYILHQKKVLLGDEMGLGKTIQAIAVMAHLHAKTPGNHFLVVCPASVMVNWCREISRFGALPAYLVHGEFWDVAIDKWKTDGGAAVTNYESMGKIVDLIDNVMELSLLVIDEAHYIKNPEARRTQLIRRLDSESERILLMTGTPLENRVDEMCELVGFVRPDLTEEIRQAAKLRHIPEFRELLAPVYLRRQREQVLPELPEVTETEEWCIMTPQDRSGYEEQLQKRNFMGMRQVSFLHVDPAFSSKCIRLAELCSETRDEGRKAVIFSYFRETIRIVEELLADTCAGTITGSTPASERQTIIDRFSDDQNNTILICQIQAGGTGLNLQAASVVIFCEPQIKPSFTNQAVSRVLRMGQTQKVLVCHLLCDETVDEAVAGLSKGKQEEFDLYADESALASAAENLADPEWIRQVIEEQRQKYLPAI